MTGAIGPIGASATISKKTSSLNRRGNVTHQIRVDQRRPQRLCARLHVYLVLGHAQVVEHVGLSERAELQLGLRM